MAGIVQETTLDRDRMELSLGDTLDVKTGILLAAITVFGKQHHREASRNGTDCLARVAGYWRIFRSLGNLAAQLSSP